MFFICPSPPHHFFHSTDQTLDDRKLRNALLLIVETRYTDYEADTISMHLMAKAGFDPAAVPSLLAWWAEERRQQQQQVRGQVWGPKPVDAKQLKRQKTLRPANSLDSSSCRLQQVHTVLTLQVFFTHLHVSDMGWAVTPHKMRRMSGCCVQLGGAWWWDRCVCRAPEYVCECNMTGGPPLACLTSFSCTLFPMQAAHCCTHALTQRQAHALSLVRQQSGSDLSEGKRHTHLGCQGALLSANGCHPLEPLMCIELHTSCF